MRGVQRLADRAAQVGLQGVPVTAVGIRVRGERGVDTVRAPFQEVVRETALFEHPGSEPDETLGTRQ